MEDVYTSQRQVEQVFAVSALRYPVMAVTRAGWLKPGHILDERIRSMWARIVATVTPDTDDTIADSMTSAAILEAGLATDIANWSANVHEYMTPDAAAGEISRRHFLTAASTKLPRMAMAITSNDDVTLRALANEIAQAGQRIDANDTPITAEQIAGEFELLISTGSRASKTSITAIDLAFGGLEKKTVTVLGGRPGMGKTALALQIAQNVARRYPEGADVFSLEMSAIGLWSRLACPRAGVVWKDVLGGNLKSAQRENLIAQSRKLVQELDGRLRIYDGTASTETIWRVANKTKPAALIIDHLRFIKDRIGENENKRLGLITEKLHDMAKALDVPILLLVQLSRGVESREQKIPVLSDLRDSGEIEENVDNVWMLYRDSYYDRESLNKTTQVWGRKFRNGNQDVLAELTFDGAKQWFNSLRETAGER